MCARSPTRRHTRDSWQSDSRRYAVPCLPRFARGAFSSSGAAVIADDFSSRGRFLRPSPRRACHAVAALTCRVDHVLLRRGSRGLVRELFGPRRCGTGPCASSGRSSSGRNLGKSWPGQLAAHGLPRLPTPPGDRSGHRATRPAREPIGTASDEEVRYKILCARAGGINISTLFVDDSSCCQRHDLLAKYGVTAICSADEEAHGSASATRRGSVGRLFSPLATRTLMGPQKLRWGLWKMPAAVSIAAQGARAHATCARLRSRKWRVDSPALRPAGTGQRWARRPAPIDALLRQVAHYEHSGRMQTQTAMETAARLSRPRGGVSACSILRQRAA